MITPIFAIRLWWSATNTQKMSLIVSHSVGSTSLVGPIVFPLLFCFRSGQSGISTNLDVRLGADASQSLGNEHTWPRFGIWCGDANMWISHQGETVSSLVVLAATKQWASYGNTRRRQVLITDPAVTMCCAMERTYSQSISSFVGLWCLLALIPDPICCRSQSTLFKI